MAEVYACECGSRVFVEVRLVTLDASHEIPWPPLSGYTHRACVAHLCVECGERAGRAWKWSRFRIAKTRSTGSS